MGEANELVHALKNHLRIPGVSVLGRLHIVSGILEVPVREHIADAPLLVPVCAVVPLGWLSFIPPFYVNAKDSWVKSGTQWHVSDQGAMCLEWKERWVDHLALLREETKADVPDLAAQWMLNSAAHVLQIHYPCHVLKRKKWPTNVPFGGHGNRAASQEYKDEMDSIRRRNKRK